MPHEKTSKKPTAAAPHKDAITYAPGFAVEDATPQTARRLRLAWQKDGQPQRIEFHVNSNGDLVLNAPDGRLIVLHDLANQFAVRIEP